MEISCPLLVGHLSWSDPWMSDERRPVRALARRRSAGGPTAAGRASAASPTAGHPQVNEAIALLSARFADANHDGPHAHSGCRTEWICNESSQDSPPEPRTTTRSDWNCCQREAEYRP